MGENLRAASRVQWTSSKERVDMEDIRVGALLRIADALEKMTGSWDAMVRDRDDHKKRADYYQAQYARECRRVCAYKGLLKSRKKEGRKA